MTVVQIPVVVVVRDIKAVVIVEAFIVRPVDRGLQKLTLPTDGFVSPSDLDLLLFGRLYKRYGGDKMRDTNALLQGPLGYLLR